MWRVLVDEAAQVTGSTDLMWAIVQVFVPYPGRLTIISTT